MARGFHSDTLCVYVQGVPLQLTAAKWINSCRKLVYGEALEHWMKRKEEKKSKKKRTRGEWWHRCCTNSPPSPFIYLLQLLHFFSLHLYSLFVFCLCKMLTSLDSKHWMACSTFYKLFADFFFNLLKKFTVSYIIFVLWCIF